MSKTTENLSDVIIRYNERDFGLVEKQSYKVDEIIDLLQNDTRGAKLLHIRYYLRALINHIILTYKPAYEEMQVLKQALNSLEIADFLHSHKAAVAIDGNRISWFIDNQQITTESGISSTATSILNSIK